MSLNNVERLMKAMERFSEQIGREAWIHHKQAPIRKEFSLAHGHLMKAAQLIQAAGIDDCAISLEKNRAKRKA